MLCHVGMPTPCGVCRRGWHIVGGPGGALHVAACSFCELFGTDEIAERCAFARAGRVLVCRDCLAPADIPGLGPSDLPPWAFTCPACGRAEARVVAAERRYGRSAAMR
jgi:hypothetical protein